ncbi:ABC transporter [Gracilibacillus boraciitolerans JCM 21714]|uniref:ABC transporter n=1 Tax=Gracilibacillus boraciitolerans JCM 21714 TaxID=1298598 RepID=W4VQ32_9BACI|nr:ABC transporter ATP-binding protein [Gracilibacillus boraciitolerans]GAE95455.1 ABC transporter [Gracilibacillus boraciitolerans JCM 21714]
MLTVKNLSKRFEDTIVLDDLSFTIPSQSIVGLTGKNGIGKTTMLNILGGISKYEGDISFEDNEMKSNFKKYIQKTSLITNLPFMYEFLTMDEMIDLIISLSGEASQEKVMFKRKMVELLNLEPFTSQLIKNLSLGTKQKVHFIISFINRPKLILIDEPFVNFDETSLENVLGFLKSYTIDSESITIFSTHSKEKSIQDIITHNLHIKSSNEITLEGIEVACNLRKPF